MTRIPQRTIDKLAKLEPDRWHQLTMQMAWHFRTLGSREAPAFLLAAMKTDALEREVWDELRTRVNARRKAAKAEERRHIERQRIESRRRYMRGYMKTYRERRANGTS